VASRPSLWVLYNNYKPEFDSRGGRFSPSLSTLTVQFLSKGLSTTYVPMLVHVTLL
jgi:hypothetical protein